MAHDLIATHYAAHLRTVLARLTDLLKASNYEQFAIHSGAPKVAFQDDYHYPFKANPNFVQLLPLTAHPHCFVVVHADGRKPLLAFLQPHDYWHVVPEDPQGFWVEHFDIRIIRTPDEAKTLLNLSARTAFVGEWSERFDSWGFAGVNPQELLAPLHWQRAWKTDYEIECIAEANRIAARAHQAAHAAFLDGRSELAIHHAYVAATGCQENQLPYGNIVCLNAHGAVLHYTEMQAQAPDDSLSFLIDAGASCNGYAADITRSYSKYPGLFADLIQALDAKQRALIASIQPGQSYVDLHVRCHRDTAELLQQFDLARGSSDTLIETGVTSAFFPHGLGHLLGIQVHDIGGHFLDATGTRNPPPAAHPYLRLTRHIGTGFVFTIEPGLYIIDMLLNELKTKPAATMVQWQRVDELRPFGGIRIEDNVLVTANGHRNLTREAFAEL